MATESKGRNESLTGLSEGEAKEFHKIFMASFVVFIGIAIIAHILAWSFRPWLWEDPATMASNLLEGAQQTLATILPILA
jgi:light-harvesting complex 1 beta chain